MKWKIAPEMEDLSSDRVGVCRPRALRLLEERAVTLRINRAKSLYQKRSFSIHSGNPRSS